MKKILLLAAIVVFSIAVYSANTLHQLTSDIAVEEVIPCQFVNITENEAYYEDCPYSYKETICSDEPINKSCKVLQKTEVFQCQRERHVTKQKQICREKSLKLHVDTGVNISKYILDYAERYECLYSPSGNSVIIICDSKFDGNGDGICQKGESCISFIVTPDRIDKMYRNSQDTFLPYDETFYQKPIELEVEE